MKIKANILCLLLEINQLFEIKLMHEGWIEVLHFAKNFLFNFHSLLLCSKLLFCRTENTGTHLWSDYQMSRYFDVVRLNPPFYLH